VQFYKSREVVGILIGIITVLSAFLLNIAFVLLLSLLAFGIGREVGKVLGIAEVSYLVPLVLLLSSVRLEFGLFAVFTLGLLMAYLRWSLDVLAKSVLVLAYAGVLPAFLFMVKAQDQWEFLKLIFFAYIVDTTSYYAGRLFGRRPLAPRLSPNKTWEGLIGGILCGVLFFYIIGKPILWAVPLALIALIGDLFKSFIKRQVGIKDFSRILGEHGGLTDRFDSVIFVGIIWKSTLI